jgi:DNA-binding LytR/AlgR family response regulator
VQRVRRAGTRRFLVLANGLEVPVSRTHAAALRAGGWIGRSSD